MKKLYFGDCLDVLKELHRQNPEGFIDLVYIDPPFNSKRNYNVLFENIDMTDTKAQKEAFADTWSNVLYIDTINEIKDLDLDLYEFLKTLDKIDISKSVVSYLTTMAIRIYYIHKVLKKTGSFYLHCDPIMSHYLKLVCDLIFDKNNFINEITFKRSHTRSSISKRFRNAHEILLFYVKSPKYYYQIQYLELSEASKKLYKKRDENGCFRTVPLLVSGKRNGVTGKPWKGINPNIFGKEGMHWVTTHEKLEEYEKKGLIYWAKKGNKQPQLKYYLSQNQGVPCSDFWDDIAVMGKNEELGYPTQKTEELLERVIKTSSKENDLIADFFCGCGTTIAVADRLKRQWIGVDISHLAIRLVFNRLIKSCSKEEKARIIKEVELNGFPKDIASANELAQRTERGRFNFQDWIVEVMLGGIVNPKHTADGGWDGYITFNKTEKEKGSVLIEVKSGNVTVKNIREFIQVIGKREADIGIFVCFREQTTKEMEREAKEQGYFDSKNYGNRIPKIQILTVDDLLEGKSMILPESFYRRTTFKEATEKEERESKQIDIKFNE